MTHIHTLTRSVLARHTGRHVRHIRPWHHLEHDLDLNALEVALIAAELEEAIDAELPADELDRAETVHDLVALVGRAAADDRRYQASGFAA